MRYYEGKLEKIKQEKGLKFFYSFSSSSDYKFSKSIIFFIKATMSFVISEGVLTEKKVIISILDDFYNN